MERADSTEIATRIMEVINTYLMEKFSANENPRGISLSVYEGIAAALVATIGITVRPENVPAAAFLIMKGISATVAIGLDEAVKLSRDLRAGDSRSSHDKLDEIWNKPATDDGKVS